MNTRELNEHVYALSKLSHIHKSAPTQRKTMGLEESKHLRILDGIALLLVTEDKGDVAAVTFTQTTSTINVCYAKNSPCNGALEDYINGILKHISETRRSSLLYLANGIFMRAIKQCIKKVRHRVSKLLNGLKNVLKDGLSDDDRIVECLFPTAEISPENRSKLVHYLQDLHALPIKDLEKLKDQIKQLYLVAMHSHDIGTSIV